jgi:diguanylate cyclase (GGDEF)-like protein
MMSETRFTYAPFLRESLRDRSFWRANLRAVLVWPMTALIVCVIGWIVVGQVLNAERRNAEAAAFHEASVLSRVYAEDMSRTIKSIDQMVLHVRYEWELSHGRLDLVQSMERGLFPADSDFYVAIIGADGFGVSSSRPGNNPYLGDREYFEFHRSDKSDQMFMGPPTFGRNSRREVIQFSRRLTNGDGSFAGVVLISVVPNYFTATFDELTLGQHGLIGVVGDDGKVRVSRMGGSTYALYQQIIAHAPPMQTQSGTIHLHGDEWFSDRRSRIVGWTAISGFPLKAVTALDVGDVLAGYELHRASLISVGAVVSVLLAILSLLTAFVSAKWAWQSHQLKTAAAAYRMATEEGHEGFFIARPIHNDQVEVEDFRIVDCNQKGAAFALRRRGELVGKRLGEAFRGDAFKRIFDRLCDAHFRGSHDAEIEIRAEPSQPKKWVHLKIVRSNGDLALTLRDVSESRRHVEELEKKSNEDALTGLPNRNWLQTCLPETLRKCGERNARLALLFVDLDGFKTVNDSLGHAAGDELLCSASSRLKEAVRPNDTVVRLGGDEFVAIIDNLENNSDAGHIATRVINAFRQPFSLAEGRPSVGVSTGISIFPDDATDVPTLLKNADIAMYAAKSAGKGRYVFYQSRLYEKVRARLDSEIALRRAIENDEFEMVYQSRIDVSTGRLVGLEALVRWRDPQLGIVTPDHFIALAEETGLILRLGEMVIDKVCGQLSVWLRNGGPIVPVSVNVSPRQFNETDVRQVLEDCMRRHEVGSHLLEVELTETSVMGDDAHVTGVLESLQKMGIKLLVDDFGTGYSSLSQLHRLDFDVLKVDRAFTRNIESTPQDRAFFTAIVTMAHALDMRVVAEGVENARQVEILRELHCDEAQGFYFSRPQPPDHRQPFTTVG